MTAAVIHSVNGVHQIDLPTVVEAVWRAAFFFMAAASLGIMVTFIRDASLPTSRRALMVSVAIVTARTVFVNVERFRQPISLEGLPVDTVWLLVALIGLRLWYLGR